MLIGMMTISLMAMEGDMEEEDRGIELGSCYECQLDYENNPEYVQWQPRRKESRQVRRALRSFKKTIEQEGNLHLHDGHYFIANPDFSDNLHWTFVTSKGASWDGEESEVVCWITFLVAEYEAELNNGMALIRDTERIEELKRHIPRRQALIKLLEKVIDRYPEQILQKVKKIDLTPFDIAKNSFEKWSNNPFLSTNDGNNTLTLSVRYKGIPFAYEFFTEAFANHEYFKNMELS